MKTTIRGVLGAIVLSLISAAPSLAVVGQAIQVQGTNLVLSWPSTKNECYMIQYRQTLGASTPWTQLTNAYPANSTNRTTFVITSTALGGAGAGYSGFAAESVALPSSSMEGPVPESCEPWAVPAAGSGDPVPAALYPPDFDTGNLIVFTREEMNSLNAAQSEDISPVDDGSDEKPLDADGTANGDSISSDLPSTGFFRVFHIPNWAFNVTNYVYDGPTFFAVDFEDYMDLMDNIKVLLDGEETDLAEFIPYESGGQTNWGMGIYLDQLTNGIHQIQLVTTLRINNEIGGNTAYMILSNKVASIAVTNQIMFLGWNSFVQGDTYTFKAESANPDTEWTIDIYDAWYYYVNSGSGHTTDGHISWTWDLTDWMGNSRDGDLDTDPWFFGEMTYSSAAKPGNGPRSGAGTTLIPPLAKGYPNTGEWLIAYQDRWFSDTPYYPADCQEKYTTAMTIIRGGPILKGDTATIYPISFGTNVYSQAQRNASWSNLLAWISYPYNRNFYYCGHGNLNSIGCDMHVLSNGVPTGGSLASTNSRSLLNNWQVKQAVKLSPYRFVFLDGCSTAAGDWPNAFGMDKAIHDIPYYQNQPNHPRPRVFIGWNEPPTTPLGTDVYHWLDFEANWMGLWANSLPLFDIKFSLEAANLQFNWLPPSVFNSKIRFYGYQYMTIRDYNRKGDWRWQ